MMFRYSMQRAWPVLLPMLLALAGCSLMQPGAAQVLGDVFIYTNNYTFDPFPDLPADFGPDVPDEGLDGLLRIADPEDACQPFTFRDTDETWVALISRSQQQHPTNCTFDVKVRHAEAAGAVAAIVYDDVYEALIIMSKPRDHPEPGIPAVFVSEKAGIIMRKLMTPGQTRVRIIPVSASAWMSLIMSAFLGFLALTVVLATFYVMRSWSVWLGRARGRRMNNEIGGLAGYGGAGQLPAPAGLPACAIRALPVLVYEGKASRRRRSTTSSAQHTASSPRTLTPTYASVGEAVWRTATQLEQQQQQHLESRVRSDHNIAADSVTAAAGAQDEHDSVVQAPALAGRTGAVFAPDADWQLLPSSAPAAMTAMPAGHGRRQQQQQQQSGQLREVDGNSSSPAETVSPPCSRCDTPLSSPGLSTDEEEPESVLVTGIKTGGPLGSRGGATRRTCVVCLERYVEGDKVRVLPCQHRFHSRCIDPWLANRRLCPVCKHDASQSPPPALQRELAAAAARAAAAAAAAGLPAEAVTGGAGAARESRFTFWRRLRARLIRRPSQQQPHIAAAAVTSDQAVAAGVVLGQPQLQPAAAYAAAAGIDAAEAGLLLPAGFHAVPLGSSQQQHSWRSRQRQSQQQSRLVASFAHQHHGHAADLITPLLHSSSSTSISSGRGRGSRSRSAGVVSPPPVVRTSQGSSAPLLIPQLTPAQSAASSAGSSVTTGRT